MRFLRLLLRQSLSATVTQAVGCVLKEAEFVAAFFAICHFRLFFLLGRLKASCWAQFCFHPA
jgi:hypothetical protein